MPTIAPATIIKKTTRITSLTTPTQHLVYIACHTAGCLPTCCFASWPLAFDLGTARCFFTAVCVTAGFIGRLLGADLRLGDFFGGGGAGLRLGGVCLSLISSCSAVCASFGCFCTAAAAAANVSESQDAHSVTSQVLEERG